MSSLKKSTTTWKPWNIPSSSISNPKKISYKWLPGRFKRPIKRSETSRKKLPDWSKVCSQSCKKKNKTRGRRRKLKEQKRGEGLKSREDKKNRREKRKPKGNRKQSYLSEKHHW
jgi:hypothetical protein